MSVKCKVKCNSVVKQKLPKGSSKRDFNSNEEKHLETYGDKSFNNDKCNCTVTIR